MVGRKRIVALTAALATAACADETISGYADPNATYQLIEMAGEPVTARATIRFPEQGNASGDAPCNSWSAAQTAPYPWIELGPIAATRRACPELADEARFFEMLGQMRLAEVQGPILILTSEDGDEMVFRAAP